LKKIADKVSQMFASDRLCSREAAADLALASVSHHSRAPLRARRYRHAQLHRAPGRGVAGWLAGCATLKRDKLDERYVPAEHAGLDQPRWTTTVQVSYGRDVEPGSPANDLAGRLLWRSLAQKGAHPPQAGGVLPDRFDFGIVRGKACR
jgi:hypothetical protein